MNQKRHLVCETSARCYMCVTVRLPYRSPPWSSRMWREAEREAIVAEPNGVWN